MPGIEQFEEYFFAVHGRRPFPWLRRLLHRVLRDGWPKSLSLPTASGKTAVMDVAVFALAIEAHRAPEHRKSCRRIVLVVDRRIVVDEASERAHRIARALANPAHPVLQEVADALRSLGGETPLEVATLRGGLYLEEVWARSPVQPTILCSTVDQVGSRLLHRGYGLSPKSRPMHAGLLANDTLIVLDEAHCSEPFRQTLVAVERLRHIAENPIQQPFAVMAMTATPSEGGDLFGLEEEDERDPVLSRRLEARKSATLKVASEPKDKGFVATCVEAIEEVLRWHEGAPDVRLPVRSILVVVNRVATARAVFERLQGMAKSGRGGQGRGTDADVLLLTGRSRPWERDRCLDHWKDRIMAGREVRDLEGSRPRIVVATQCVEVGADLDLDALVTEVCPLDALRQRLGRVDRLGERGESPVVVVCRKESDPTSGEAETDPVYGEPLVRTWSLLREWSEKGRDLDLGIRGMRALLGEVEDQSPLLTSRANAPLVFPVFCDLWVQTGPEPVASPEPALFLHGPDQGIPDVQVVWRADLPQDRPEVWSDIVALCPPSALEAMPVPLHLVRQWLSGSVRIKDTGGDLPDGEGKSADGDLSHESRPCLSWRGPEDSRVLRSVREIGPGEVLVVPSSYGGCDAYGWNPTSTNPVTDLAEEAIVAQRRRPVLRVTPSLWAPPDREFLGAIWNDLALGAYDSDAGLPEDLDERLEEALRASLEAPTEGGLRAVMEQVLSSRRRLIEPHPGGQGLVVSVRQRIGATWGPEDSGSLVAEEAIPLEAHLDQVCRIARQMAVAAGLPDSLVQDISLAAALHDIGKADPRFQVWMAGGDFVRAARQGLVAKSGHLIPGSQTSKRAREMADYPRGARHEAVSMRLAECSGDLAKEAGDRELLLHLILSHHGHGRPWMPLLQDERPLMVRWTRGTEVLQTSSDTRLDAIDSGVAERFFRLIRRYGWWGLSYLETFVKLADYRASAQPDGGKVQDRMEGATCNG